MYNYDTGGIWVKPFLDQCGYCSMDTGGNHEHNCPAGRELVGLTARMLNNEYFVEMVLKAALKEKWE